ncbi:MAG TPA: ATP-binding cassette domain-containing protein [Catalimonadaceae bacterium]|nr:ATP-binding cassette domain-containing protein [Catalimonadaceae bacterium]
MSEPLLLSLIQLFAIASKFHQDREKVREIVRLFLEYQLSIDQPESYLRLFEEHLDRNSLSARARKNPDEGFFSVRDSSRMVLLCSNLNEELNQQQKLNVVIVLISLIDSDGYIHPQEMEFLHTVSEVFNISHDEFHQILRFCSKNHGLEPDFQNVLIISSNQNTKLRHSKHIYSEKVPGYIAVMRLEGIGSYHVKYSGSKSLTLNGVEMLEEEVYHFSSGGLIKGDDSDPIYYSDIISKFLDDQEKEKITFDVSNVVYKFPNGKVGLHELSFSETSGRMVGLMGASGAGKSTLLEVLNGNLKPCKGEILINGLDLHKDKSKLEGVIGYVPQDDLLIEELTVFQNLYFAARLSFGEKSEDELNELVNKTLGDLGLTEIGHLKVGNPMDKTISGGERKRVNIGLELLRAPGVLFLDEPTSGLSSRDSQSIIELLKELSLLGKLVFVVIHQPSSDIFKLFDRLLIMDTGGFPIYYGNPIEAIVYFKSKTNQVKKDQAYCYECGHVNPEVIFDLIEARRVTEFGRYTRERKILPYEWYQEFKKSFQPEKQTKGESSIIKAIKHAAWPRQFGVFIKRDVLSKFNNKQYLAINLIQAPLLALLLALINRHYSIDKYTGGSYSFSENENLPVFIFISIIVCLFLGLTVSAEEIFHDRKILKREKFLNLSRSSYLLSKVLILFSLSAFQTLSFWLISSFVLEISQFSFIQLGLLFSATCFANMLGLNISSSFNQAVTIYILIPILLIPQLVLGGIVIKFSKINPDIKDNTDVPLISEMMASRWAYEGLMVSFFKDNEYNKPFFPTHFKKHVADNHFIYVVPELEAKVQYAIEYAHVNLFKHKDKIESDMLVLRNEFANENKLHPQLAFPNVDRLKPGCNLDVLQEASAYLARLRTYYSDISRLASVEEGNLYSRLEHQYKGNQNLNLFRLANHNRAIERFVKNSDEDKKIIETDGRLVQMVDPIYKEPSESNRILSRAHFFAPYKYLFGMKVDTAVFNIFILWVMTGGLYVLLYFDGLKKIIELGAFKKKKAQPNV